MAMLVRAATFRVSVFLRASIVLLKFLFIVLETRKAVAKEITEGLHTCLALLMPFLLGKFGDTYLLGPTVDFRYLLLGYV